MAKEFTREQVKILATTGTRDSMNSAQRSRQDIALQLLRTMDELDDVKADSEARFDILMFEYEELMNAYDELNDLYLLSQSGG